MFSKSRQMASFRVYLHGRNTILLLAVMLSFNVAYSSDFRDVKNAVEIGVGAIVAIVIGVLAVIILCCVCICRLCCNMCRSQTVVKHTTIVQNNPQPFPPSNMAYQPHPSTQQHVQQVPLQQHPPPESGYVNYTFDPSIPPPPPYNPGFKQQY